MKTEDRKQLKFHLLLIFLVIIMMAPLIYMISCSFKTLAQIFSQGLNLIPNNPTLENYEHVFQQLPFFRYVGNSILIATVVMMCKMFSSVLAGYAFTFMDFPCKNAMFYLLTITMFIPFTVIMIPNYLTLAQMGMINNLLGVSLPQLADAMGIFLMRQSMRAIPKSLLEVARLDKVSHTKLLLKIIVPLCKPSIFAMCIMFFINSWNEYFWPMLILTKKENYTITLAMQMFLSGEGGSAWGSTMALAALATLVPLVLYLFSQRFIINTYMSSGIKE